MHTATALSLSEAHEILTKIENRQVEVATKDIKENKVYFDQDCDAFYKLGGVTVKNTHYTAALQRRLETELLTMQYASLLGIAAPEDFAGVMVDCQNENLYHGKNPYHAEWSTVSLLRTSKVPGQTVAAFCSQEGDETQRQEWLTRAAINTIVMGTLFDNTDCNSENTLIDVPSETITQIDMAHATFNAYTSPFERVSFLMQAKVWWYNACEQFIKRDTLVNEFTKTLQLLDRNKHQFRSNHYDVMSSRGQQGLEYARTSYRLAR